MSSLSPEGDAKVKAEVIDNRAEGDVQAESCNHANRPSKKQHFSSEVLRTKSSPSPEGVQQAGLKILLEAERTTNPQSCYTRNINEDIKMATDAASQSLPILVPTQCSPHQAWSEQTAKWCYDVLDHLQLPREIVYLSMNLLEKALLAPIQEGINTHCIITNKHGYEKMAIASLFLAVRLVSTRQASKRQAHLPRRKLQISELLTISGSSWSVEDIQQCSSTILQVLGLYNNSSSSNNAHGGAGTYNSSSWNFPLHQALVQATPHSFCKLLFFGFHTKDPSSQQASDTLPRPIRLEWLELALYLIELSVCDGGFHRLLPSVIALASLQTAAKILLAKTQESSPRSSVDSDHAFQASQQAMEETLRKAYGVSKLPNTVFVGNRLEFIYQQSQDNRNVCDRTSRNNNNATRRTNKNSSTASGRAFACPTLIIDDEEDLQLEHNTSSFASPESNQVANDTTTTVPTIQAKNTNQGAAQHPIRHIQSDLDLEALGRQHHPPHELARMHRPISPCPKQFSSSHS